MENSTANHSKYTTKYPIGIQSFAKLIEEGYLYVDKTAFVHQLAQGNGYYFLSRPRWFGKSLLLSTIHEYFAGHRELFHGLDIYSLEKEWKEYPVLHFDMNIGEYQSPDGLRNLLTSRLEDYEAIYGRMSDAKDPAIRFLYLVESAHKKTGEKVVILVDEYEKPLLSAMDNEELQDRYRAELKPFYGVLKTCDEHIRFAMLTGVTRLGKMSVFSDLNNLKDLSMDVRYASICGVTHTELLKYFNQGIECLSRKLNKPSDRTVQLLKRAYDGYRFSEEESEKVFNPFSLLNALESSQISDYWFESGTPTYLIELLKRKRFNLWNTDGIEVPVSKLKDITSYQSDPIPLLYQSGYLTIKDFDSMFNTATLTYPNDEVKRGFMDSLMSLFLGLEEDRQYFAKNLYHDIESGNVDDFMCTVQSLFAAIPYAEVQDFNYEAEFRNVMFIIFTMLGIYIEVGKHVNTGRIDLVVKTSKYIYVMEFKTTGTPEDALKQIAERGYARPFAEDSRQIIKVGAIFSAELRNLSAWETA